MNHSLQQDASHNTCGLRYGKTGVFLQFEGLLSRQHFQLLNSVLAILPTLTTLQRP
jgi:hypothetical protein